MNKNNNNKKWRNAGLYALLLIVVLALGSAFLDRQPEPHTTWKYSKFLEEVRNRTVESVRLSADRTRAKVPTQDGTQVYVNLPNDEEVVVPDLRYDRVSISGVLPLLA